LRSQVLELHGISHGSAGARSIATMAESGHRITRPEFPDYRELFRESDIKSAVVDSIGQRNSYVKT
ncbi:hypothetical protein, partial [Enterobacter chengduensis]|uniref:hypothetical protein n=1 Tax=Enterobacter chengduensis TaxID=2494701 RepID=UPI002416C885